MADDGRVPIGLLIRSPGDAVRLDATIHTAHGGPYHGAKLPFPRILEDTHEIVVAVSRRRRALRGRVRPARFSPLCRGRQACQGEGADAHAEQGFPAWLGSSG